MRMKRMYFCIVYIILMLSFTSSITVYAANVRTKTREINIVYDDSGSMAAGGVTSWSQAKYALEVFVAMMDEQDTINIYPMSSYSYQDVAGYPKSNSWKKVITVKGTESVSNRVKKIEQMNGDQGIYRNTPIGTVTAAGEAIIKSKADDRWLVILTDGAFDEGKDQSYIPVSKTKETILSYASTAKIRVAYVAIGEKATAINGDDLKDCFFAYRADQNTILTTVTEVGRKVFNYQAIDVGGTDTVHFTSDIPISKIIIFAQGDGVSVGDLTLNSKKINTKPTSVNVNVLEGTPYFPQNKNYGVKFAPGLNGSIITYEAEKDIPFEAGNYSFLCNTKNVEVYFEPGVDVHAVLEDASGNETNISETSEINIEAGEKTIHLKIYNPITGEPVSTQSSSLLKDAILTVTLVDLDGNEYIYSDGQTAVLKEGAYEVSTKAVFKGDLEKNSEKTSLKVETGALKVEFVRKEGYKLNPVELSTDEEVLVTVSCDNGRMLSATETEHMEFEVSGVSGIAWDIVRTNQDGKFRLIPKYVDEKGLSAVQTGKKTLKVQAKLEENGITKTGNAKTDITSYIDENVGIILELIMPQETYEGNDKKYMFDSAQCGKKEDVPYILVDASIVTGDSFSRSLTEEEWEKGLNGFNFHTKSLETDLGWKIIKFVCRQSLDFEVELGDKTSTYKLYLAGLTPAKVLPNTSELQVELSISLDNGIVEEGATQGIVTIKPVSIGVYIGWLLLAIAILILLTIILIMELQKKRFDRRMYPNTTAILTRAGVSIPAPMPPRVSRKRVDHKFLPPWKAEERDIVFSYEGYLDAPIRFHCVATGHGNFKITNVKKFAIVKEQVRFDGVKYDTMLNESNELNMNSDIIVYIKKGNVSGRLIMTFYKQK